MILPNKHISTDDSLLGVGAIVLQHLNSEQTVTRLWEQVRAQPGVATFERFILALDLLYTLDTLEFKDGLLRKRLS